MCYQTGETQSIFIYAFSFWFVLTLVLQATWIHSTKNKRTELGIFIPEHQKQKQKKTNKQKTSKQLGYIVQKAGGRGGGGGGRSGGRGAGGRGRTAGGA